MILTVKVVPGAKRENVALIAEGTYRVHVMEQPEKGKANLAVLRALARELDIPVGRMKLLNASGRTKRIIIKNVNA